MTIQTQETIQSRDAEAPKGDLQVVARVAAILRLFSPHRQTIRPIDASEELGLQKSTAHRYLSSLENHGLLKRVDGTCYTLGPVIDRLSVLTENRLRLMEAAGVVMEELSRATRQTSVLSVWGGDDPVIARAAVDPTQDTHVTVRVGASLPLSSAQGLTFLAFLHKSTRDRLLKSYPEASNMRQKADAIRAAKFACHERVVDGIRAISIPVFSADGEIQASLALVGTANGVPPNPDSGQALALKAAGQRLMNLLSGAEDFYPDHQGH